MIKLWNFLKGQLLFCLRTDQPFFRAEPPDAPRTQSDIFSIGVPHLSTGASSSSGPWIRADSANVEASTRTPAVTYSASSTFERSAVMLIPHNFPGRPSGVVVSVQCEESTTAFQQAGLWIQSCSDHSLTNRQEPPPFVQDALWRHSWYVYGEHARV